MRHRITYIHAHRELPISNVTYLELQLNPQVQYSREDKVSFDTNALSKVEALRILIARDVKSANSRQIDPFASYDFPVGVTVYALPSSRDKNGFFAEVNSQLQTLLGITVPPESWLLSLNSFVYHSAKPILFKIPQALEVPADWSHVDYTHQGSKAVVRTYAADSKVTSVAPKNKDTYTEIGVFEVEKRSTQDDLVLKGALVTLNDKDLPPTSDTTKFVQKSLFHIKPRHRILSENASIKFNNNGMHPVLEFGGVPPAPMDEDIAECKLYSYLLLDKSVFLDPYQVPSSMKVIAKYAPTELERPEYTTAECGDEILFEILDQETFELTLNSRYLLPDTSSYNSVVPINAPSIFYACDVHTDAFLLNNSPFNAQFSVGGFYDALFTNDTVFYHVQTPKSYDVSIPHAWGHEVLVNIITLGALICGFAMIMRQVFRPVTKGQKQE